MLIDNMKGYNLISMVLLVVIWKKDIICKFVNIFLVEMRSVDLKSFLWKDFIEICEVIYDNNNFRIEKIFVKGEEFDIYLFFWGVLLIKYRKKILFIFDDNYLWFCFLYVFVMCNNIIVVKILIYYGVDLF